MSFEEEYILKTVLENEDAPEKLAESYRRAEQALDRVNREVGQLKSSFAQGRMGLDSYQAELKALTREAKTARSALDKLNDAIKGSGGLSGKDRAGAKARLGLAGANILQDMAQGGPAAGINNLLGLAGDKKVMALGGEWLAAAGGIGAVATALGTVAVAAGAAFLVIDGGLKSAKLEWSDFGSVVANLGPINAAGEAFSGLGIIVTDVYAAMSETTVGAGAIAFVESIGTSLGTAVGWVDQYTLQWGRATDAARAHKEELERGAQAAAAYAKAVENLGKFKSDEDKQAEKNAQLTGEQLAKLGGKGGADALAAKLAEKAITKGADDKVKVQEQRKNGEGKLETVDVEVTRREAMKRDILSQMERARNGDPNAIGDIARRLQGIGLDAEGFKRATQGHDAKAEAKEAQDRDDANDDAKQGEFDAELARGKARKQREQGEARRIAASLLKGEAGDAFLLGQGNDAAITADLGRRGMRTDDPLLLKRVRAQVDKQAGEMMADQASEKGLADVGAGGRSLVAEREKKRTDEQKRRQDEADREQDKVRREQMRTPGLDDFIRDAYLQGANERDLGSQLESLGLDEKTRGQLLSEGRRNAQGQLLKDSEAASSGRSQVLNGGAALRDSIQGGVKADDLMEKQLKRLESIEQVLRDNGRQSFGLA